MLNIYVYVLNTLADWEIGYITSELNSGRFFKKDAKTISLKTVSCTKDPIKTMGGLTVLPDCLIDDIILGKESVLLLPGADTWSNPIHFSILEKANELLSLGGTVGAICGATVALANFGILNDRPHTSNGPGFLDMFAPSYTGQSYYIDQPSVSNHNLITASVTGGLLWSKQILEHLDVFKPETLNIWYEFFSKGNPELFYALMQSVQENNVQ